MTLRNFYFFFFDLQNVFLSWQLTLNFWTMTCKSTYYCICSFYLCCHVLLPCIQVKLLNVLAYQGNGLSPKIRARCGSLCRCFSVWRGCYSQRVKWLWYSFEVERYIFKVESHLCDWQEGSTSVLLLTVCEEDQRFNAVFQGDTISNAKNSQQ